MFWFNFVESKLLWIIVADMDLPDKKPSKKSPGDQAQGNGEPVWVQCEGFRCLAVRDRHGTWKIFYDGVPLSGVIKIVSKDQMSET
jgi:hypothetical protein